MGGVTRKSFAVHICCSILIAAFLIAVPIVAAVSATNGSAGQDAVAGMEIKADPLHRLPASPEEAHQRVEERKVSWPASLEGEGGISADSVRSGVSVSIPYDTVSGYTSHANSAVKVTLTRAAVEIQVVNTTTDADGLFTADLSGGVASGNFTADALAGIQSGDTVTVEDLAGGTQVNIDCTLTDLDVDDGTNVVSGTALAGSTIDVYISAPSTYYGDIPPGVTHKSATGANWNVNFTDTLNLLSGDVAFIFSTDGNGNSVMDVANSGGSLAVYPQYNDVLGYYDAGELLTVKAGSATQEVGTAGDGFFEAWFTEYNIVPGDQVSCVMGTNRAINVAAITADCDPATNMVSGTGPANKAIRVTMDVYGNPVVIEATTDAQGSFAVDLDGHYTATGSDVYSVTWYDADGDCVVYEFQTYSWNLAEGYTGGEFDTYVLVQNPGVEDASVTMTFQPQAGVVADPLFLVVAAGERETVHLNELPGLTEGVSVSTMVTSTSGAMINAERAMYFNYYGIPGGHDSIGTISPAKTWYLAEGYTGLTPGGGTFDTYVLVQNPTKQAAQVTMEFQLDEGVAPDHVFNLDPETRETVHLDGLPGLEHASVSTKVTSDVNVVAERAMYFSYNGLTGGHDSIGVTCPRKTWYMAEGYTGTGYPGNLFDTWVLVQNPSEEDATVTMEFQLQDGTAPDHVFNLPAGTRESVDLDGLPGLGDAMVSTKVTSDVDVVSERAMYFNYYGAIGGHDSKAANEFSDVWYLAEGFTGNESNKFDTYVLVQNPGTVDLTVTLEFQLMEGTAEPYVLTVKPGTRQTVCLDDLPGLESASVSTKVTALTGYGEPGDIVVERAMYFDYYGRPGGHDSIGVPQIFP